MEEIWEKLGGTESIQHAEWPTFDEALTVESQVEIVIQINGKLKQKMMVEVDLSPAELEAIALADEQIKLAIEGKTVRKVIAVPNRLVNIVAN